MKLLNAEEISYVSGGLSYEVYEATFSFASRVAMGSGIIVGIVCSSTSPATTFLGSLYHFGYYGGIGAAAGFALAAGELISNILFLEYSPMIEAKINSFLGIQPIS